MSTDHGTLSAELWLRRFQPGPPDGPRLVLFPHAGGAASFFIPLAKAMAPVAEVLAVQYPGRQDRRLEPLHTSIAPLADALAEVISGLPDDRPLVLFGHSMGAIVAFEVIRRLAAAGGPRPALLVVSGRRAPSAQRDEAYHLLPEAAFVAEMATLGGTDPRVLAEPELLELILPPTRADYQAIETYVPDADAVISTPVVALIGDTDPRVTTAEAQLWHRHTTASLDLRQFPGGHFYLVERHAAVADTLAQLLAALSTEHRTF
ncbi:pyochelin biosynthesis protein PchC [Frankia sp. AiPs1]|uniref:thioesterase II family protein n=1 Tax=Frankia sp. AiPa1 TaxID=573492 RepID=UPI00202B9CF7|nr:alpha/beta fold hydrolase [Frankia sp. AiPa1]MCL9762040.1 alpha/beta fold hydrolase [Frankia sp. AiPa1]